MGEVVGVVPLSSLGVDSLPAAVKREVRHELSVASSLMGDLLVTLVRNRPFQSSAMSSVVWCLLSCIMKEYG